MNEITKNNDLENQYFSTSIFSQQEIDNFIKSDNIFNEDTVEQSIEFQNDTDFYIVLIVDDEKDIHSVMNINLSNFTFKNKKLHFFNAYSSSEAKKILQEQNNIALIFLDVVMETQQAGLDLVQFIREEQKNELIQIVLHTGQPGQAPEKEVIAKYNINSYQLKTDFTETKIFSVTSASLRAYEALKEIKKQNENLEIKVAERTNALKMALDDKNKMFSIIAHDVKNPFNSLLGFTSLLKNEVVHFNRKDLLKHSAIIHDSAEKIYNLLENLLEWARTQTGTIEVKAKKININGLIHEIINLYKENAESKSNTILFNAEQEIFINADEEMTKTVIRNLISNAIKFTESGTITIDLTQENDFCNLSVTDTGMGISEENLKILAKKYFQIPTKGTRKEKGTGLGLVICDEFLKLNGGNMSINSQKNKGSQFQIQLPLLQDLE